MTMQEERLAVLKMIEEGKITAQEGMELMDALKGADDISLVKPLKPEAPVAPPEQPSVSGKEFSGNLTRMLRIRVREGGDKTKVNINIPLQLVKLGVDIAKSVNVGEHKDVLSKIDMDQIIALIDEGAHGKLLEVESEEDQTFVEIFVD